MSVYVEQGTRITCTAGHHAATANRDVSTAAPALLGWFDWEIPEPSARTTPCPCGARYVAVVGGCGYLHVEGVGWKASDLRVKRLLDELA